MSTLTLRFPFTFWSLFLPFFLLITVPSSGAEKKYIVRKNDTLIEIARRHRVSATALMRHNRLDRPNSIHPGDVLRIPGTSVPEPKRRWSDALQKRLDAPLPAPHRWQFIVIHHSATDSGTVKGMDRYHREHGMENGLAYHFVIGNGHGIKDGEIAIGRRWAEQLQGGHLKSEELNEKSIGICLVGNFDEDPPTAKQMSSLHALVDYLMERCHLTITALKTHQQINPIHTRCPGRHFPSQSFVREFSAAR
jgi:LysM repeat protein